MRHRRLCIGVVGEWGVGKSFILRELREKVKKSGKPVFYYDAWKY